GLSLLAERSVLLSDRLADSGARFRSRSRCAPTAARCCIGWARTRSSPRGISAGRTTAARIRAPPPGRKRRDIARSGHPERFVTALLVNFPAARPGVSPDRPVRPHVADMLGLRDQGRPQAAAGACLAVPGVRGVAGPGRERGGERREGRRAGGVSLWSAGKTRACPGAAR